ncbi:MAG: prolyl oligopeptidase family serine peptidase [Candidatus Sumerlaeota bacterium]|nr:prolyl oligopeptidase family serine peptidase [Candidatus Sumerlaeota bacterium]
MANQADGRNLTHSPYNDYAKSAMKTAIYFILEERKMRQRFALCAISGISTLAWLTGAAPGAETVDEEAPRGRVVAPAVAIPLDVSPVVPLEVTTLDDNHLTGLYRKPAGDGPFPAIISIHGDLNEFGTDRLRDYLVSGGVHTRLLNAGFVIIMTDFRTYSQEVQSKGPLLDTLAFYRAVCDLPFVDSKNVFLFGGSGGGSIALDVAGAIPLRGIICGEPATILYTGILTTGDRESRQDPMQNPLKYFTDELQKTTLYKLSSIRCPVLILHGDVHALKTLNLEILPPMMKKAGVDVKIKVFPGSPHGFYFNSPQVTVDQVIKDILEFTTPLLSVPLHRMGRGE